MVVTHIERFQARYREIVGEPGYVASVLKEGALRVEPSANQTVRLVKQRMGLYS
jgi:tryptophanyl-tRNA synthetase